MKKAIILSAGQGSRPLPDDPGSCWIGRRAFRGERPGLFRAHAAAMMRMSEGVLDPYLKAIDALAASGAVGTASIAGLPCAAAG